MRPKFFLLAILFAIFCKPLIAECASFSYAQGMTGQESISTTASRFATSYNQAHRDKENLTIAAYNNDHEKSQELIRSYNRNMKVYKDSYQILQAISKNQGTGDITLFFQENSAALPENDFQYKRFIRYLDSLERNNWDKKLIFVIMGSASAKGEENHNKTLSRKRANAPIPIIDQYLINVPHSYHKVYGTGEANSPQGGHEDINKRYRFVRIMALYEEIQSPAGIGNTLESTPMMGQTMPMRNSAMIQKVQINEYINPFGMKFIRVPAGTFVMGSPETEIRRDVNEIQHEVTLTQPFYLQSTEVTQQQWAAVMGTYPSHFENCGMDCPVENVRYSDVKKFLKRLNQMESTIHYRLPTEAEWEYAARAGTNSAFFNGPMVIEGDFSTNPYLDSVGWYYRNSRHAPHRVAQKSANAWGFFDMHGNVWEWCSDWQRPYPFHAEMDPKGAKFAKAKIRRGGSWAYYPEYNRSAYRSWFDPEDTKPDIGFRVAITKLEKFISPTPKPITITPLPMELDLPPMPKPRIVTRPKLPQEPIPMPKPAEITQCILIRDITFNFNSDKIRNEMVPLLDRAVEILKIEKGKVELHGHTCSNGSKQYNMLLGLKRAESIKRFLISRGIAANRISIKSFGEESPKFTNLTEAGRSLNRRVEILVRGFSNE